jgi:hypothetical protein
VKFNRKIKPSKAVGKPGQKPVIQGALVKLETVPTQKPGGGPNDMEPKDHLVLYATNAYSFIRIDLGVKDSMDEPGPIPAVALKHLEKGVSADLGMDEVRVGITRYERVTADGYPHADTSGDSFPDFEEVMDKHWREPKGANELTVNVNPRLLIAACEAIGEPDDVQITLDLRKAKDYEPQVYTPEEREKRKGKVRRFYSGAMKLTGAQKQDKHPAIAYLMPITPREGTVDKSGGAFRG